MSGLSPLSVIEISRHATAREALATLGAAGVSWGYVVNETGAPDVLVGVPWLSSADPAERVEVVCAECPRALVADTSADLATELPDLLRAVHDVGAPGVLVKEDERIVALLPEPAIASFVVSSSVLRGGTDRLEGSPLTSLIFECPDDGERLLVGFYDPNDPPRCGSGHLMRRVHA